MVLYQNYTSANRRSLTLSGFNKVKALCVLLLLLNSQCHGGELMAFGRGPDVEGVLNSPSHLRFRLSESRPNP